MPNGIRNHFIYAGRSSRDFGIQILDDIYMSAPERSVSIQEVPGYGTYSFDDGYYQDIVKRFPCRLRRVKGLSLPEQVAEIIKWLRSDAQWQPLRFTGQPGYFYSALCYEGFDVRDIARRTGEFEVPFRVKPYRWRDDGEIAVNIPLDGETYTFYNAENVEAKPVFEIEGNGEIVLRLITGNTVQRFELRDVASSIRIDCELQQATQNGITQNTKVYSYPFPVIPPGETRLEWEGEITGMVVIPRWRGLAI